MVNHTKSADAQRRAEMNRRDKAIQEKKVQFTIGYITERSRNLFVKEQERLNLGSKVEMFNELMNFYLQNRHLKRR